MNSDLMKVAIEEILKAQQIESTQEDLNFSNFNLHLI
jgi:hypothetical protein